MRLKLSSEVDVSTQSTHEHVARAFAAADAERMAYLNQRIKETQDEYEGGNPYQDKPKPPPHVKPPGSNGWCIVCKRKWGPCLSLDSPYRKENQNATK